MTIKNIKEVEKRKTKITRITILEEDGSETVINVSEAIHFIFAFAKSDPKKSSAENTMEVMVFGDEEVCGEMYFQMGNAYPPLVNYCAHKSQGIIIERVKEAMAKKGTDPLTEIFKRMPVPGDGRAN